MLIKKTRSVCPVCLKTVDAQLTLQDEEIVLSKICEEHGDFSTVVWCGKPDYFDWTQKQIEHKNILRPLQLSTKPCPQNCGLCVEHKQSSCTVLLELTQLCNLSCPICFANSQAIQSEGANLVKANHSYFTSLEEIYEQLEWITQEAGQVILQLSGGEPTLYPHLLEVVQKASTLFPAVQLNTNGILLAKDETLAQNLKKAGLSWVFLQFDAHCDEVHLALRGKKLNDIKEKAIANCQKAGLSVVLVSVLVRGVNDNKIGELLDFALAHFPTVRGVHFQPMTKSGRNQKKDIAHITLPEVISLVAQQSKGQIDISHAHAPDCEHTMCAFHCRYFVDKDLKLQPVLGNHESLMPLAHEQGDEVSQENSVLQNVEKSNYVRKIEKNTQEVLENAPKRSINSVIRAWGASASASSPSSVAPSSPIELDAFDTFIQKAKREVFSITCMAFQDVHTLDLERLQQCCIHIYAKKNGKHTRIPFCAYNLTSLSDEALHRNM